MLGQLETKSFQIFCLNFDSEPTGGKLQLLLARLENGDVDLALTKPQLQCAEVISKACEHQQTRVVPRAEHKLYKHAGLPEEAWHLQVIVGTRKGHRFE